MGNVKTEGDWHHIEDAVYIISISRKKIFFGENSVTINLMRQDQQNVQFLHLRVYSQSFTELYAGFHLGRAGGAFAPS